MMQQSRESARTNFSIYNETILCRRQFHSVIFREIYRTVTKVINKLTHLHHHIPVSQTRSFSSHKTERRLFARHEASNTAICTRMSFPIDSLCHSQTIFVCRCPCLALLFFMVVIWTAQKQLEGSKPETLV